MNNEINDMRKQKEFSGITFSKYKKAEAKKELLNNIKNNKIESACYWSAEYICAGHFAELWDIILNVMSNQINIANPKLPIYIDARINEFKNIVGNGYIGNEIGMRNNKKIREMFCEIISVLCLSNKNTTYDVQKINQRDYNMENLMEYLKAPSINYGRGSFSNDDPKELFIAINELAWNIRNKNSYKAFFWIEWLIGYEDLCKKKKKTILCKSRGVPVDSKYNKELVWLIWDVIINECKKKHPQKGKIINALLNSFCLRYSSAVRKKRRYIIYFAISLLTQAVSLSTKIVHDTSIAQNAVKNIDKIYKQIKVNEVAPKTSYLFSGTTNDKKKNMEKINNMGNLANIIIRN